MAKAVRKISSTLSVVLRVSNRQSMLKHCIKPAKSGVSQVVPKITDSIASAKVLPVRPARNGLSSSLHTNARNDTPCNPLDAWRPGMNVPAGRQSFDRLPVEHNPGKVKESLLPFAESQAWVFGLSGFHGQASWQA